MSQGSNTSESGLEHLAGQVDHCRRSPQILADLVEIYRSVEADVAAVGATCLGGGGCCRFDLAGHRLYVSTAELALLMERAPQPTETSPPMRCPYQSGSRCTARLWRPLGCRAYFCRADLCEWSARTYETYHGRIRDLHARNDIGYAYVELTVTLNHLLKSSESI